MNKKRSTSSYSSYAGAAGSGSSRARSRGAHSARGARGSSYGRGSRPSVRRPAGDYSVDYGEYGYGSEGRGSSGGRGGRRPSSNRPPQKRKRSKLKVALVCIVLALVCAGGAAFAYFTVLEGNLHAGLGGVEDVLVDSDITNEPFYMLLLGTDGSSERDETVSTM